MQEEHSVTEEKEYQQHQEHVQEESNVTSSLENKEKDLKIKKNQKHKKNFYAVAKGRILGIFTEWSSCESSVLKFHNAVHKGFQNLDQAINFLLVSKNTPFSCESIPIFDKGFSKTTADFGHECSLCTAYGKDKTTNMTNTSDEIANLQDPDQTFPKHAAKSDLRIHVDNASQNSRCTVCLKEPDDRNTISCSMCLNKIHFQCTKLPTYQLYIFSSTSRKYTCEICANVPDSFNEKWKMTTEFQKPQELKHDKENKLDVEEIISNLENNIAKSIKDIMQTNNEKDTQILKNEICHQKDVFDSKIEKMMKDNEQERNKNEILVKKICELTKENADTNSKIQLNNVMKTVNTKLDTMKRSTDQINESYKVVSTQNKETMKLLQKTAGVLSEVKSEIHSKSSQSINNNQTTEPLITKTNTVLSSNNDEGTLKNNQRETEKTVNITNDQRKKILLLGNSQLKGIDINRFNDFYQVVKKITFTIEEAIQALPEIEKEVFDGVVVHLLANDVKDNSAEDCFSVYQFLVDKLKESFPGAKIIVSTGIARKDSTELNQKMYQCNIKLLHKYIEDSHVHICDNSGMGSRGMPINRLLASDGLHLSHQGTSIFAANMKQTLKEVLPSIRYISRNAATDHGEHHRPSTHRPWYYNDRAPRHRPTQKPIPKREQRHTPHRPQNNTQRVTYHRRPQHTSMHRPQAQYDSKYSVNRGTEYRGRNWSEWSRGYTNQNPDWVSW